MNKNSMSFEELRAELPLTDKVAYFQTGSHGPTPDSVTKKVYETLLFLNHNGLSVPQTREVLNEGVTAAKGELARLLNIKVEELAWTANTSQAMQKVLHGVRLQPGDEFIVSSAEHVSTQGACQALENNYNVKVKIIPAEDGDDALLTALAETLTDRTRLVCLSQVSTMDGRRLPIAEATPIAHARGVPVMVDGAQSIGQYRINISSLNCDFFIGSCHKWLLGTKGLGFMYVSSQRILDFQPDFIPDYSPWLKPSDPRPTITAETRVEQGTSDLAIRIGMNRTLEIINALSLDRIEAHSRKLVSILFGEVGDWAGVNILSPIEPSQATGLVALVFDGYDEARLKDLIAKLMEERLVVKFQPEPVAMRISLSAFNNEDEVYRLLEALKRHLYS